MKLLPLNRTLNRLIKKTLRDIEFEHGIYILFAVESGSRMYGLTSPDSDFDLRFVYVHRNPMRYHDLFNKPREEIEKMTSITAKSKDERVGRAELDIVGWELGKFLRLLVNNNCHTVEWMYSPMVYYDYTYTNNTTFMQQQDLQYVLKEFSLNGLFKHYNSLAKGNYHKYVKNNDEVIVKKVMYVLRGIFMAYWITENDTYGYLTFSELKHFASKTDLLTDEEKKAVQTMYKMKRKIDEKDIIPKTNPDLIIIKAFVERWFEREIEPFDDKRINLEERKRRANQVYLAARTAAKNKWVREL